MNESLHRVITALLNGDKVFVSSLGYLVMSVVGDRKTVFFKPVTKNVAIEIDEKDIFGLKETIAHSLEAGKTVNIPEIGTFRPVTDSNGSFKVSFVVSPTLRAIVNGKRDTLESLTPVTTEPDMIEEVKEVAEIIKPDIVAESPVVEKQKIKKPAAPKKEQTTSIGRQVIPLDEEDNSRSRILSFLAVAVLIVAGLFVIYFFFIRNDKSKSDIPVSVISKNIMTPLTELAEKAYGNSVFWVYIYDFNRNKLRSPINIPKNVEITIPSLDKEYSINPADSADIKNAVTQGNLVLGLIKNRNIN
ncbi:MAG: hypothetical protein LBJ17_06730 [Dysgonamonadaceae bacterium]|jgi:hypothetical protein|nr:hypothetical protein [Dysgonamonadaceae bacterium]